MMHAKSKQHEMKLVELAKQFGMPVYSDLKGLTLPKAMYKKIPYSFVKRHIVLPIGEENGRLIVAIGDPLSLQPLEELRLMLDQQVKAVYAPKEMILAAIHECYNRNEGEASEFIADLQEERVKEKDESFEMYDLLDDSSQQAPIIKLLNLILSEAIQQFASDIHFEPHYEGLRIRYRIDGVLQDRHAPAPEFQAPLLSRIKVMAKLDIAERRLPQDGRMKLKMGKKEIDFRVSTVPASGGERIVLRILDKGNVFVGLDQLGMLPKVQSEFEKLIRMPEGILLVTGPTGSGKTTTLYSAISHILSNEINIMTIEDPIEYQIKGIAQVGVRPNINLTFATGLKHILRQDPDVIMVGEIRDSETSEIAVQASLTGHLVLSTLHTNDAPSAITRIVDMGIEPYLISSSLIGVMAQRLVRRLCPKCKKTYTPRDEELGTLGLKRTDLIDGSLWINSGCSECFHTGYRGRKGLYELMIVNPEIHKQIIQSPDAQELRKIALRNHMVSLLDHGKELIKQGVTTVSEVLRVTRGLDVVR